jgi:HK97 family phage prohead protease
MNIERKFIDLKALKVSDEGSGTIEGYRSVFNEIDEGGDIIIPGAFKDCTPEYLSSGFTAHSHDWDFDKAVGFPIEAHEDEHGWFVKSQFHSTPDAQNIRTKAKERMQAGKTVGFSFGYSIEDFAHIESKDIEKELGQYIKADRLADNLVKARKYPRIRILKKVSAIEDSLVTAPMNKLTGATAVKSETKAECDCPSGTDVTDCPHVNNPNLKEDTGTDSFESFESAVSELEKFAQKMQSNHDNRVKDGRVLSASNRAKVQACYDALGALLTASEPKPKEKEIDVEALRTQSLRMQSLAVRALA